MNEKALVRKLQRFSPLIGDDCAVIGAPARQDLLFTTDFTIEGVHFRRELAAEAVGYKALARSLSDIAAMGGTPLHCLVSLALAPWTDQRWVDGFYRGLNRLRRSTETALAGGDLSHAPLMVCDVMVCGSVPKGKALLRSGARLGDVIYVSGPLGGWTHKPKIVPRLTMGRQLVGRATSCMDISDGLAIDLHTLCRASGVSAALNFVPLLREATLQQALYDGEDYELLYTARPSTRIPGIQIGVITDGRPGSLTLKGAPLKPKGYDHFENRTGSD
ncbi:MAG: thiamine-phosphate kinase [Acidobacteriota bacterium]|nr:thiamine-phosphate kinase [Acidobacteriota bacterium]